MSSWAAIFIGLLVGSVYIVMKRISATSSIRISGGGMILKWPQGIGRASVVEVCAETVRLSSPVMRQNYEPPKPGTEILLKPIAGGPVKRAKFVAHGDSGWTVRLG